MNPPINLYAYVLACLRQKRIRQRAIAAGSGVPFSTVTKIAQGSVRDPSVHTVQRLYDWFRAQGCEVTEEELASATAEPQQEVA